MAFVNPSRLAVSRRNKAAATWLHVQFMPAIHAQCALNTLPSILDKNNQILYGASLSLSE